MHRASILALALTAAACVADDPSLGTEDLAISSHACPDGTPAALAPPEDQDLAFVLDAEGTQNYTCTVTDAGSSWVFVAPDARLFKGCHQVGIHYAGPSWKDLSDHSIVVGKKVAATTVDATAIPWLLLSVASYAGPDGRFSDVTAIQRLETTAGLAPTTVCDATNAGATYLSDYTARYFFYRTSTKHPGHNTRCGAP